MDPRTAKTLSPEKSRGLVSIFGSMLAFLAVPFVLPEVEWIRRVVTSAVGGAYFCGCIFYPLAKGRSPWWAVIGIIPVVGVIVLLLLPDRLENRSQEA